MDVGPLVMSLRSRGVQFILDGDSFRIRAPKDVLTLDDKRQLQERKADVVQLLRESCRECGSALYWSESFEAGRCVSCQSKLAERVSV